LWRYVVVVLAVVALYFTIVAATGSRPWDSLTERITLFFTISLDIQLLVGLAVWVLADYDRNNSYLTWIHPIAMIAAIGLAHAGRVVADRQQDGRDKGRIASGFFVVSLLIILIAVPIDTWLGPK
jgi:hypothetical protein